MTHATSDTPANTAERTLETQIRDAVLDWMNAQRASHPYGPPEDGELGPDWIAKVTIREGTIHQTTWGLYECGMGTFAVLDDEVPPCDLVYIIHLGTGELVHLLVLVDGGWIEVST